LEIKLVPVTALIAALVRPRDAIRRRGPLRGKEKDPEEQEPKNAGESHGGQSIS
jgi:hypothetical protein